MSDHFQVQQVLGRYVRAVDRRDGAALSKLFTPDATVTILFDQQAPKPLGQLVGAEQIGQAVAGMLAPHAPRGWSHHMTFDHLIEMDGNRATLDAQFVMFLTLGNAMPEGGWPRGLFGAQGSVAPREAGYYRSELVHERDAWLIHRHTVHLDLPQAFG